MTIVDNIANSVDYELFRTLRVLAFRLFVCGNFESRVLVTEDQSIGFVFGGNEIVGNGIERCYQPSANARAELHVLISGAEST